MFTPLDDDLRRGWPGRIEGDRVIQLAARQQADTAKILTGVKEGDVLLKVDGQDVASLQAFSGILRGLTPGQTVKVVLSRGGAEQTLDVTVAER